MAVAMLQAPIRLHQSCKYLTSHLMAHHEEPLEPSTQAMGGKGEKLNVPLEHKKYRTKISEANENLQSQQQTWMREMYWPSDGKARNHIPTK